VETEHAKLKFFIETANGKVEGLRRSIYNDRDQHQTRLKYKALVLSQGIKVGVRSELVGIASNDSVVNIHGEKDVLQETPLRMLLCFSIAV
jgi:hypothetical protein